MKEMLVSAGEAGFRYTGLGAGSQLYAGLDIEEMALVGPVL